MTTSSADSFVNGTIQASRIPRSTSSTLHDKKPTPSPSTSSTRADESISPVTRKPKDTIRTKPIDALRTQRRPLSRTLLPFPPPPPPSSSTAGPRRPQEIYLILNPKDDKCERRVILIPPPTGSPIRVGRVINPSKIPAKFDNLLFDTKVLSRNHAEVFCDVSGRVFIRDLGSSNGTYINGFRLSPDAISSEPFQLFTGQELALGIDIREETNQDNIAYHRVWFTVEHVGPMNPPPPEAPTPSTLGAVDLDPWIPKPSTRDIVDHLVQEINAAKAIAEEITSVQSVLDGMMEGTQVDGGLVERVTRELEEKTRRVEELEGLLGVEREEKRILEERIRNLEDERAAMKERELSIIEEKEEEEEEEIAMEMSTETIVDQLQPSPVTVLAIPVGTEAQIPPPPSASSSTAEPGMVTPPASPSTAPSSPLQDSSTRSISPISLPSTESSQADPTTTTIPLLEKIALLESQLSAANKQIADLQSQTGPVLGAVSAAIAASSSVEFPFTFTAPTSTTTSPRTPRLRRLGSVRKRKVVDTQEVVVAEAPEKPERGDKNRELIEGLCAAVGVVVLGWMGMWLVNHLVERGERVVK